MTKRCLFHLSFVPFVLACFAVTGSAQSNTCVITEKRGSLVTMTCPGEGTKVINMGGTADIYKPGDTISFTGQSNKNQQKKRKVR